MKYIEKLFKSIFILLYFFVVVYSLFSKNTYDWPILSPDLSGKITSLFGESRGDHFHNGVDISTVNQPVMSLAPGKLLYSAYSEDRPFENAYGPGNSVWMYHGEGVLSAYYHLKDGRSRNLFSGKEIGLKTEIGISGNSGHSGGAHLHFVVADQFGKRIIDPLKILPAVSDTVPPEITNLFIHVSDHFTNVNEGEYINLSANFPVTVRIRDAGERKFQNRGIRRIEFSLNGEWIKKASFDVLYFKNGIWSNPEGFTYDQLYFKNDYLVGTPGLKSGENTIKVIAEDYHGNLAEKTFTFYVNRTK